MSTDADAILYTDGSSLGNPGPAGAGFVLEEPDGVYSDSEFMCRQMQGKYKIRSANIRPLYEWACKLAGQFDEFQIEHTAREGNQRADALARQAAEQAKQKAKET